MIAAVIAAGVALILGFVAGCYVTVQYVRENVAPPAPASRHCSDGAQLSLFDAADMHVERVQWRAEIDDGDDEEDPGCGHDVGIFGVCHECRRPRA